jgi:signal peptidase I, archaeal type
MVQKAIIQLAKKSISKGVIKDIIIVGVGVLVIWIGLQVAFGTQNPFYVVASGSMIPELLVYDVLVVQGHEPFEDIEIGDIIVFNRPSDHNRVIVHRVVSIINDDPKTIRTQGDANPASIPGTDFPITEEEYIGKVAHVLPQVGYVTQLLKPPVNYVIIVIIVGIMVIKQITKKKKKIRIKYQIYPIQKIQIQLKNY